MKKDKSNSPLKTVRSTPFMLLAQSAKSYELGPRKG